MFAVAVQVVRGRWFMLFASFMIMAGAGATYLFGVYSKEIKRTFGYDQKTLNMLGFFKDLGATVGVLSGLLSEVTPVWLVLLVGSAMNFAGYFMIWLSVTGRTSKPRIWQMCTYILIGANSQNFANTGVLATGLKNFPERKGIVVGLLKGYTGLSGAVMTQLYLAIYGDDSKSLILLIGWLPAVVSIFFVYTIRERKVVRQENETKALYNYLFISIALALFVMAITIIQKQKSFSHAGYVVSATVVSLLLFLPLGITIREELLLLRKQKSLSSHVRVETPPVERSVGVPLPNLSSNASQVVERNSQESSLSNIFGPPNMGEDYSILQALLSIDMLLLFLAGFAALGTSLTAIDNLGQIGESLGYPTLTISTFVSLVSIWNFFGRVGSGFISEILITRWGFPRTLAMTLALLLSSIGYLMIAFPVPGSLYLASVIIGFCFGVHVTLFNTITADLFGLKHYATLFNCGVLASPLGSYVFNVRVAGVFYDREAMKQLELKGLARDSVRDLTCIGKQCYREAFIVLAAVSVIGAAVSLVLVVRTRKFYKSDIYKKYREEADEVEAKEGFSSNQPAVNVDETKIT